MLRVSRKHILFNCMQIVVSLALIGLSIWLHFSESATLCVKVLEKPFLILGVTLLLFTVIELVWSLYRLKFILVIGMISLLLVFFGMLSLTVFSILVTNKNMSKALFGRDGNYSHYLLEKYVMDAEQIKSCLVDFEICQRIPTGKGADFYSHIQSSCCKPPTYCGLEFHNATYWTMPKGGLTVANNDCKIWNNIQSELCCKCESCKTAFYNNINTHWKILSYFSFFLLLFAWCLDCCDVKIKNRSKGHRRHKVYLV